MYSGKISRLRAVINPVRLTHAHYDLGSRNTWLLELDTVEVLAKIIALYFQISGLPSNLPFVFIPEMRWG